MTVYRADLTLPVYLERGREQTISFPVYDESSTLAAPDAADTVSVLKPDGTALVDAQTVTVTASVATYTLTPAASETLGEGWQVVWNLTLGTDSQRAFKADAALVRQHLYPTVTNAHLLQEHPELTTYPSGDTSWDDAITTAWRWVQIRLLQAGRRPYLVLNPWTLHEVTKAKAFETVFRSLSTYVDGERYTELAAEYRQRVEDEWGRVQLTYDEDNEGDPDEGEQSDSLQPVIFLSDPPRYSFWQDTDGGGS